MEQAFEPDIPAKYWLAMALALSLPTEFNYWQTIQATAFGMVLYKLFVQGPASALLLQHILAKPASPRQSP